MIDVDFQIGDKIIDSERIYEIFDIKDDCIFYRISDDEDRYRSVVCSIPTKNALKSGLRKLISKKEAKELIPKLVRAKKNPELFDIKLSKEAMLGNCWEKNIEVLMSVWMSRQDEGRELSRTSEEMAESIIGQMVKEISLVTGKTSQSVRREIVQALGSNN